MVLVLVLVMGKRMMCGKYILDYSFCKFFADLNVIMIEKN